jgi:hypothetical protein
MQIHFDISGLDEVEQLIQAQPKIARTAMRRALNRVGSQTRTALVKNVAQEIALKQKDIRSVITLKRASAHQLRWFDEIILP